MKLRTYHEFLFESYLLTSDHLANIINSINEPIAVKFTDLINKDIKTKYNLIDLTDTNDKLAFMPDSQATTKMKAGVDPIDLFKELPNKTTIGRVVRAILTDNGITFTERDIEKFVNKFKSAYDAWKMKSEQKESIKVVYGEDIRHWYLMTNYCEETLHGKGSLGKSCMRYSNCQEYLDIYVNNPYQVGLVIYLNDENKLKSRALLWQTEQGTCLDRIYYTDDSDANLVQNWVREKYTLVDRPYKKEVKLTGKSNADGSYDYYPYMDQFMYYYTTEKTLYNYEPSVDRKHLLELQDTGGQGHSLDTIYCEYEDEYHPADQVVYSERYSSYLHRDNAVHSNYENDWIWVDNSVWSEWMSDYLDSDDAVKVYLDEKQKTSDWYPTDHEDVFYNPADNEHYYTSLTSEDDEGNTCLKKDILTLYEVSSESVEKYREIYNIPDLFDTYLCPEIDEKVFDIKLDKSKSIKLFNKIFYEKYYRFILVDNIDKMIEDFEPWEIKSEKEDQLTSIDEILTKSDIIYKTRYQVYRFKGIKQFLSLWQDYFRENWQSEMVSITSAILRNWSDRRVVYKNLEDSFPDFIVNLKSITEDFLEDPQEYFYGFHQTEGSSETNKVKQKLLQEIITSFTADEKSQLVQNQINDFILWYINQVFRSISSHAQWNSFQGIRWFPIFDVYLRNQNYFKDIKQ